MAHLIINDRPPTFSHFVIYPNNTSQTTIFNDLHHYSEYHNHLQHPLYAITLTIPPDTAKLIQSKKRNVIDYFKFTLKNMKYSGIYITEYTNKGIEHIHGLLYLKKHQVESLIPERVKIKQKWQRVYTNPEYPFQHIIKPLKAGSQQYHWKKYMIKQQLHQSVLDFFNTS